MSRIQSSVGLITGIPIEDTVNKLMQLAAQPKNTLDNRTKGLQSEKLAVTTLASLLVAFQFETKQFGSATLFDTRTASSSDSSALAASVGTNSPAVGDYLFTPVQSASSQQLLSQSYAADEAIGAGSFSFGAGGYLDSGISLDELNNGDGVRRGKIRITDRNGDSAVVDLSFARTVDDVLAAINENTSINVTATAVGDSFKLADNSGGGGNLKVQEVSGGSTAADLGLASINVAANTATGTDIFSLHGDSSLASLNDGNGVQLRSGNDLTITLADESTVDIDLGSATTLGDVLDAINAASPTKVSAAIGGDGNRIVLTDLTTGSGTFAVANVGSGTAADDLGLSKDASGATLTGARLVSGLKDTLVSSLKGGKGLGALGQIDITNRNNVPSSVNLSAAETVGQVIAEINSQAVGVTAELNRDRSGIVLKDTTGLTASNLIVADGDATNSATALGSKVDAAQNEVNGGALRRQQVSEATLLSSLNGGNGINVGDLKITDSNGVIGAVDLDKINDVAKTVGDVIARINAAPGLGVHAQINERGDGIVLIDTAGGSGTLKVTEVGNGTTAKDLRILGSAKEIEIEGVQKKAIDGSATSTVTIDADDTLAEVVTKINDLNQGVTASVINDGTRQRLSITVNKSGAANALLMDTSDTSLSFQEVSAGRDALVLYGTSGSGGALISSASNTFDNIVNGLNVTVNNGTLKPVTVSVKASSSALVSNAKEFVAAYNSYRKTLDATTSFNEEDLTTGILFGSSAALQIDTGVAHALSARFFGVGKFTSLEEVGFSLNDKGQLELDEKQLTAAFNKDSDSIKKLFTEKDKGVAAKLSAVIENLAGKKSTLSSRADTLSRVIESNKDRLNDMTDSLDRQRERLLLQFYNLETMIAKMRDNLSALGNFQAVPPMTSSSK